MLIFNCPELFQAQDRPGGIRGIKEPGDVNFDDYRMLHREGKSLIRGWFKKGWTQRVSEDSCFEAFIFTWIAFNSWGACVTSSDKDADIMDSLAANRRLSDEFDELVSRDNSQVSVNATKLLRLMPIFDAKSLRSMNIL